MENTRGVSRAANGSAASVISATEIWELPAEVLPPKVGHFSLSEAGRVVGAASVGAPGRRLVDAQAVSINYGAVANERRA